MIMLLNLIKNKMRREIITISSIEKRVTRGATNTREMGLGPRESLTQELLFQELKSILEIMQRGHNQPR